MADLRLAAEALREMAELLGITEASKSIDSAVSRFTRDFIGTLRGYFQGRMSSDSGLSADLKEIVSKGITDAFHEGMKEAGIDPQDFTADDAQAVDDLIFAQFAYVDGLAKDAIDAKGDKDAEGAILDRTDLWAASVQAAGDAGKLSAAKNEMLTLVGNDGKENCRDCKRLKNQRHRADWWVSHGLVPVPGNTAYECGNWNCEHYLQDDAGERWSGMN